MTSSDVATVVLVASVLTLVVIAVRTFRARARGPGRAERPAAQRPPAQRPPAQRPPATQERNQEREPEPELPARDPGTVPPERGLDPPESTPTPARSPAPPPSRSSPGTIPGPCDRDEIPAPEPPERPVRRPGVGRILLVDPDPESRSTAMRNIAAAGYEVVPLTDAGQTLAVYLAADPRPDIVVAPAFPPGLSGAALAERLRAVAPTLPVVLLSPYEPGAVQAPAGVRMLSHPFNAEALLLAIADGLSGAGI